jgi:hypothetical protein
MGSSLPYLTRGLVVVLLSFSVKCGTRSLSKITFISLGPTSCTALWSRELRTWRRWVCIVVLRSSQMETERVFSVLLDSSMRSFLMSLSVSLIVCRVSFTLMRRSVIWRLKSTTVSVLIATTFSCLNSSPTSSIDYFGEVDPTIYSIIRCASSYFSSSIAISLL